jgi:hypothetical protein
MAPMTAPTAPTLAELQRWMMEMPVAFAAEPEGFPGGHVRVHAVMADLLETLFGAGHDNDDGLGALFHPANHRSAIERNRLRLTLATAHLLWNPQLRRPGTSPRHLRPLFSQEIPALAAVAQADDLPREEHLREELIRRTLRALGLGLAGESAAESEDRLRQVDSVERHRLLRAAAERERRSREVREALARKAAEEAAAKVSRE